MLAILEDELWKYSNLCFCLERMHRIIMYSDSSHSVLAICETKHAKAKYWISIKSMKKMGKERKRKKKQNPFFLLWHRYFLKISAMVIFHIVILPFRRIEHPEMIKSYKKKTASFGMSTFVICLEVFSHNSKKNCYSRSDCFLL